MNKKIDRSKHKKLREKLQNQGWMCQIFGVVTAASVTAIVIPAAEAITIRHDRSDLLYRNLANSFSSVGRLSLRGSASSWGCSGTLIDSRWLLTAAHCFEDSRAGYANLRGGTVNFGSTNYSIIGGVKHRGWRGSNRNLAAGFDLGLFLLNRPVANARPATLFTGRNEDMKVGTYVGYGATGTGITGFNQSNSGTKRAGQNIIELGSRRGYSNQLLISDFDDPRTANSNPLSQPLNLEANLAPGDSGGALFINGLLAGVNSFIGSNDGRTDADYGDWSGATRVSSFASWIRNVMRIGLPGGGIREASIPTASSSPSNLTPSYYEFTEPELPDELRGSLEELTVHDDVEDYHVDVPEPTMVVGLLSFMALLTLKSRRQQAMN